MAMPVMVTDGAAIAAFAVDRRDRPYPSTTSADLLRGATRAQTQLRKRMRTHTCKSADLVVRTTGNRDLSIHELIRSTNRAVEGMHSYC